MAAASEDAPGGRSAATPFPVAPWLLLGTGFLCVVAAAVLLGVRLRAAAETPPPPPPRPGLKLDMRTRGANVPEEEPPAASPLALYGVPAAVGGVGLALDLIGGALLLTRKRRGRRKRSSGGGGGGKRRGRR